MFEAALTTSGITLRLRTEHDIVLDSDRPVTLSGLALEELAREELGALRRLADVSGVPGRSLIVLRRNRRYRVGRLRLRNLTITVPPDIAPDLFVDLFLYAYGVDLERFVRRPTAPVELGPATRREFFLKLLAYLLVEATERLLTRRIARAYTALEERIQVLRGRPRWTRDFGHHPNEGVTCRHYVLQTDNVLNRLVLAGLRAAGPLLRDTPWVSHCQNQVFIWRSIASEALPRPEDFILAERGVNRLTEHYRPVLALSRAVTLGLAPEDPFSGASSPFQTLEFSLPILFERFVFRVLRGAAAELDLEVHYRRTDPQAILDGSGESYRSVEPDIVLFRRGRPVAVIDAKYKPRYVTGRPARRIPPQDRVSNADIYQLFFYQSRLMNLYRLEEPCDAVIVAPQVPGARPTPDAVCRTLIWRSGDPGEAPLRLLVIPVPLADILASIRGGSSALQALASAPELIRFLRTCQLDAH
jgi:hypothetical protein